MEAAVLRRTRDAVYDLSVPAGPRPAGLVRRGIAALIDLMILTVGVTAILVEAPDLPFVSEEFVIIIPVVTGYRAYFEWRWGATIGKWLLRIRVVTTEGDRVSLRATLIREVFAFVDFMPIFFLGGLGVAVSNARCQRLGDLAAGTMVTDTKDWRRPGLRA